MKTPSNHLHQIIKSLTKQEKRYFRLNAFSNNHESKYLVVFDAIDAQAVYDEKRLRIKFKDESWINRLNVAKDYLYKALLNSLSTYNQKHEPNYQITDLIVQIKVLQNRGFYERCDKLIDKAKELANQFDDHLSYLRLLEYEGLNNPGGINPKDQIEILKAQQERLHLLDNEYLYAQLYKQSYAIFSKSGYQGFSIEDAKKYSTLLNNPLLKKESQALTFNAKRQFISIYYFFAVGQREYETMHTWILKAIALFKSNPKFIELYALNYATTLLNLQTSYQRQCQFEKSFEALDVLKTFYPKHLLKHQERLTYIINYAGLHHRISAFNVMGDFEKAKQILPELDKLFVKHKQEISAGVMVRHAYLLAETYFGNEDYLESKTQLEKIIIQSQNELRRDIQRQARVLLLLVYYEMEKIDLLETSLRSIQRLFLRNKAESILEKMVLGTIKLGLDYFENQEKLKKNVLILKKQIVKETFVPNYDFVMKWLVSKEKSNTNMIN